MTVGIRASADGLTGDLLLNGNSVLGFNAGGILVPTMPAGDNSLHPVNTSFLQQAITNAYGTAANLGWNSATDTYIGNTLGSSSVTDTHRNMKRCVLRADGSVNYYLHPLNSNLKEDGVTASVLTGADGDVMVEIPAFYIQYKKVGTVHTYAISSTPRVGFVLHPAFIKAGIQVPFRYYSAYDACVNTSVLLLQSGLNYDSNIGAGLAWNTAVARLASVSGIYPAVGAKRSDFRAMATNKGVGWAQNEYYLFSAIQLLYVIEYQTFRSQSTTGQGNTNVTTSYPASSGIQTDSPHSIAGKSNSIGNATGWVDSLIRDTAWMSYRGIENLYGNCWNWCDGFNILLGIPYACADYTKYADDTAANYVKVGNILPATSNYISDWQPFEAGFIASNTAGGSSTSFIGDYMWSTNASNTVLVVGGGASGAGTVGLFYADCSNLSSNLSRGVGARLTF